MSLWGKTDEVASKPKYLSDTLRNDQTTSDLDLTVGVSTNEAKVNDNKARGVNTPGWVKYVEYTDANGNVRHKSEVLVAMSSITGDGDDDFVADDPTVQFSFDSTNVYIVSPANVTLTPTITKNGDFPVTYQWFDASNDTAIVGQTGTTLSLTGITAPQAYYIKATYNGRTDQSSTVNVLED